MIEQEMIEEKEIHLRDYFRIVQKRKATVVTVFLIVFALVLITTFTTTPQYNASTKVLIEKNEQEQAFMNYAYTSYDPEFLATQSHIIKSTPVAKKVVDLLKLEKTYETFTEQHRGGFSLTGAVKSWISGVFSTISDVIGTKDSDASMKRTAAESESFRSEQLARLISNGLMVNPVPDSRIVTINFTSPNPVLATRITNSVAKAYIEQILEMRMKSSSYSIGWMTRKAEEERSRLETSENVFQQYMKDHDILTIEDRITILPQKLADLNSKLTSAQARRKELETVFLKVKEVIRNAEDPETLPVIAENATLKSLNQQILKARQHVMELSKKYGPKHPLMKNAHSDLGMLTTNRDQELARIIKTIENDYELSKSNEENLQALLSQSKSDTVNLNERFIQYGILKRDVETNRNLYNALVSKIKEQSITEQIQTVNVWVVEEARVPDFPSKPNKSRNLLLGIILGLFGGIGLVFFLEYLDNTIKLPEDIEDKFGLPVLGLIPLENEKTAAAKENAGEKAPSAFSESFKTVRDNVQLSTYDSPPKSILITSTSPQDGKTTTAINLAIAMSRSDKKVLLIDADLRRPQIHKIFKLDNSKGLSTSMAGASDMKIVQKSRVENLDIIPSGPIPPNPSELLGAERFRATIKVLVEKYDVVVIDSPPLLSVSDGYLISKVVSGTILVTRSAKTTHDALHKGLKQLQDISSKILGVIINGADMKKAGYYYYQQYQYYYSSDEE